MLHPAHPHRRRGPLLALAVLACLLAAAPAGGQEWRLHTVGRGETLFAIARRYDVTVAELREWNNLHSDRILAGQRLRIPEPDQEIYVVRPGDTLSEIAARHDVSTALLRQLNGLNGSRIQPGQKLKLRPSPGDAAVHVVMSGETLSGIALQHGLPLAELRRINGLDGDGIRVGQKLRLREAGRTVHIVESGDALWEIARAYGVSVAELKRLNGLTSDRIHPGQELQLSQAAASRTATYKVRRGDNLTEIARLHQMGLRELRDLNGLRGSVIHPGQILKVRPRPGLDGSGAAGPGGVDWAGLRDLPGLRALSAPNGPYYNNRPRAERQRSRDYAEENRNPVATDYRQARRLWEAFTGSVDKRPRLSNRLAGWHFVLDPGHGGVDPGTIKRSVDADGKAFYIVEDEYVYDLALRVYVLLRLHGADVTMTLLSPNHLLRGNAPVNSTFVHERNEVINSAAHSRRGSDRPRGGQKHLDARVSEARDALRGVPRDRQVFLSFHADNVAALGDVVTLFYLQNRSGTDTASRDFARRLLPAMGAGARIKGKNLGVLRNNPARYKLLVEMRNLAFADHIWSIRYEELRQRDAAKIVQALLDTAD